MAQDRPDPSRGTPSTAAIGGHPIHPMLVVFPIACFVGGLLTDLAYWLSDDSFWARGSRWLIGAGLITGAAAALAGLTDFLTIQRVRRLTSAWVHFLGNATVLVLSLINLVLRLDDAADAVVPTGLILSAVVSAILTVTGWLGGELSYRHKIGVVPSGGVETETPRRVP